MALNISHGCLGQCGASAAQNNEFSGVDEAKDYESRHLNAQKRFPTTRNLPNE